MSDVAEREAKLALAKADGRSSTAPMHPPFEPGNAVGVRSGAWSDRLITETVDELRPQLQRIIDQAPWCRPVDELALEDFMWDLARAKRLERFLIDHGDRYPDDHPKYPGDLRDRDLRELNAIRNRLLVHRARLGLDPASRARMNLDRAVATDLASMWAEGQDGDASASAGGPC